MPEFLWVFAIMALSVVLVASFLFKRAAEWIVAMWFAFYAGYLATTVGSPWRWLLFAAAIFFGVSSVRSLVRYLRDRHAPESTPSDA